MAVTPISSAYAAAETVAMPTHQAGDTIIVFVSRRSGSTTPALVGGWTNIANANRAVGTGNWSARIAYKVAASSSETVGTWSSADDIMVLVYRGVTEIGVVASAIGAANTTVAWPAATLLGSNGESWVARFGRGGGAASTTSDLLTNPIGGYTFRQGNDLILAIDTGPVGSSPVEQTQVTSSTNYWYAVTVELRAVPAAANSGSFFAFF